MPQRPHYNGSTGKGTGDKSKVVKAKRPCQDDSNNRPGRKRSKANGGTAHRASRAPTRKKATGANEDVVPKPRKCKRAAGGDEEKEDVAPKLKKTHKNTAPDSDADAALLPKPRRVVKVTTPASAGAPPADTTDTASTSTAINAPGPASGAPASSTSPSSAYPSDVSPADASASAGRRAGGHLGSVFD
ncbi:hypothetical protein C8R44DRAFT_748893 [Mycena epipterygia]|nr:hypothetical protein C8R44DRAFT_748893 [Mycena epipterygia]